MCSSGYPTYLFCHWNDFSISTVKVTISLPVTRFKKKKLYNIVLSHLKKIYITGTTHTYLVGLIVTWMWILFIYIQCTMYVFFCCRVKWYNNEDKVWLMYCNVIWRNRPVAYSRIYWVYMTSFNNHFSSVSSELFYCDVKNLQECLWFPVMGDN